MKIELDTLAADRNLIQSYSAAGIIIKKVAYQNSIIVSPDRIIENWPPHHPADLTPDHLQVLLDMEPELVLLGTGSRLQFPDQQILATFLSRNIGIEVMDTTAACRAYNFIAGEDRKVVAALISLSAPAP
jgi:uncharacterized protein